MRKIKKLFIVYAFQQLVQTSSQICICRYMYMYYIGIKNKIYCIFSGNYLGSVYFAIFQIQLISAVKLFIVCHKTSWQFKSVLNKIQVSFNLLLFILIGHELLNTLRNLLFYSKQLRLRSSNKLKSFQNYLSQVYLQNIPAI